MKITKTEMIHHAVFLSGVLLATVMMFGPLNKLFMSEFERDYHTLIPFIPIISIYLLYLKKKEICADMKYSFMIGACVIITGIVLYAAGMVWGNGLNINDYATVATSSALVMLWGFFILAYGTKAFYAVLFPLLFLVLMIPIPFEIMEEVIAFLQKGSTEFVNFFFWVSQVPYYREGFTFQLLNINIAVAPECSGIRSGLALFITAFLAGYMFLNSWWRRFILVLLVFPVTMLKNGIRISTLTLLANYIDPRIVQSSLHREGGIPFFILALLLMAPILYFLRRTEKRRSEKKVK